MAVDTNSIIEEKKQADSRIVPTVSPADDLPIKTQIRYDTAYSLLLAPLFALRYCWLFITEINPFNFLKIFPKAISNNFAAHGIGATFLSIIGLYSRNTLHDINSLYAESVGYELDKKKEDVTYKDIFFHSKNTAVKITCDAYVNRTFARIATACTAFIPWHKFRGIKTLPPKYEANANGVVGAVGIELLWEGYKRKPSFFDIEQKLASNAINHTDNKTLDIIKPKEIMVLLSLHQNHLNENYKWPEAGSASGCQEQILSERIANLMNQTYQNSPNTERANFTIGKFNYLTGFGLLDKPLLESLAFVELASKSKDMSEVKTAASAIKNGGVAQVVFKQFGIDMNSLVKQPEPIVPDIGVATTKFMDTVRKVAKDLPLNPKTHIDFATQTPDQHIAI